MTRKTREQGVAREEVNLNSETYIAALQALLALLSNGQKGKKTAKNH